jgi:hypothetical protein
LDSQDCYEALGRINNKQRAAGELRRVVELCIRHEFGDVIASPVSAPDVPLSDKWKRALRDSLGDLSDWRHPQIVTPQCRREVWPQPPMPEIDIRCGDRPADDICRRVLVTLDGYHEHQFTMGDVDPWRAMEYRHRPEPGARTDHPCILPRPPSLWGVPLEDLVAALPAAIQDGWHIGERFYYVPPGDYQPFDVNLARWRHDRAFPYGRHPVSGRSGFVDCRAQVWRWHPQERHWDVQLGDGSHINVSHDGREV